jgi:hypothetical protein
LRGELGQQIELLRAPRRRSGHRVVRTSARSMTSFCISTACKRSSIQKYGTAPRRGCGPRRLMPVRSTGRHRSWSRRAFEIVAQRGAPFGELVAGPIRRDVAEECRRSSVVSRAAQDIPCSIVVNTAASARTPPAAFNLRSTMTLWKCEWR